MSDFIPFPNQGNFSNLGNPKLMHPEFVSQGAQVRAKTIARAGGDTQDLEATATLLGTPVPLSETINTYGMTGGAYATATDPQGLYSPMSWITFTGSQFTTAGLTAPSAGNGNVIDTQEAADTYEDFVVDVALTSLAQFHQAGNPICVDIEDIGVDAAIGRQDLMRAARERDAVEPVSGNPYSGVAQWQLGYYSDNTLTPSYDATTRGEPADWKGTATQWSVAAPLIKQMLINIRQRIHEYESSPGVRPYATSPIGFYQVGPACWYTGFWSGCMETDLGTVGSADYRTGNVWQQNLKQQTSLDSNYYGWQCLDDCDFAFYAYYLMSDNRDYLPFTVNPQGQNNTILPHWSREKLSTFFYWLLAYFGPSTDNWDRFGKKFMIGMSMENELPLDGSQNAIDYSGDNNIWKLIFDANSGQFPTGYDYSPWDIDGYLTYPDVTGEMTGGVNLASAETPDLIYQPKKQARDMFKWLMADTTDSKNTTGWQRLPWEQRAAGTTEGTRDGIDGTPALDLPDSIRDFKFAIWDGIYTGGSYSTGGANDIASRYEAFGPSFNPIVSGTGSVGKFAQALYLRPTTFAQWVADGEDGSQAGVFYALQGYADFEVEDWIVPMFTSRGDGYDYSSRP